MCHCNLYWSLIPDRIEKQRTLLPSYFDTCLLVIVKRIIEHHRMMNMVDKFLSSRLILLIIVTV